MSYYRRGRSDFENLMRWRRNIFLQTDAGYVLLSATQAYLAVHQFDGSLKSDPVRTVHVDLPPGLFDGRGWNLIQLTEFLEPERQTMTENQQPYAALYCKPLRASIRNLTDIEMKVFVALVTYADDQGICFPGVRALAADTGKSTTDVSEALDGLKRKGFFVYLRHKAIDPITRKIQADVYGLTAAILYTSSVTGIQTYMHEFLNQIHGESLHNQTPGTNTKNQNQEPTPGTTTTNQLQESAQAREMPMQNSSEGENSGKAPDYANQSPPPAAQPQPKEPENDLPPRDTGKLDSFIAPLPQIDAEAYAQEMRQLVSGLQLAKARQLVTVYGIEMCGTAVRLLAKQSFKSVDNPPGWIINKLRQGALLPVDAEVSNPGDEYWKAFPDLIDH